MEEPNPYGSPSVTAEFADAGDADNVDPEVLHQIALRLDAARLKPPTIVGSLGHWSGLPRFLMLGALGVASLYWVNETQELSFGSHGPALLAGVIVGSVLRDVTLARRFVLLWKPQSHFIDWKKVEETLRQSQ